MKYASSVVARRSRLLLGLGILLAALLGWVATDRATAEPKLRMTLTGHTDGIPCLAYSSDGTILASGSVDNSVKLWDPATGKATDTLGHTSTVFSLCFTPNGKTLFAGDDDTLIKVWDVTTGKSIATLQGHNGWVKSLAITSNGNLLASGSGDKNIKLWDLSTGKNVATLNGHSAVVSSLAFSPNDKVLASASADQSIKLWDVASGKNFGTLNGHSDAVWCVAFSPDGKLLASASDDKTIKLWDTTNGKNVNTLKGHTSKVNSVSFSADGKTLASASEDKSIKLWDVTTGTSTATLTGHTDSVYCVAFSRDGTLASASKDKTVKVWQVDKQEPGKMEPDKPKQRREEEEEDPMAKPPPTRKIRFEEEDPNAKTTRPGVRPAADFSQLAREAKNPAVQELYRKFAVPHDLLTPLQGEKLFPARPVAPVEQLYGNDRTKLRNTVQVTWLEGDYKPGKSEEVNGAVIKSIEPYELFALSELDRFHKANKLEEYEQLVVDEQVISGVMRFHDSAKADGGRKGDWSTVETRLRARLMETLLNQLAILTKANDWNSAFALATRIADSFPGESDQQIIAPRILELLQKALTAKQGPNINSDHLRDVHLRLRALIEQFPNNLEMQKLKLSLKVQAEKLVAEAESLGKSNNKKDLETAQEKLRQAEELWPTLPILEQRRLEIRKKYPILKVAVRQLPRNMSPQTAVSDSELRAVELMFESLVKFSPDGSGMGHYHPGLSEGRPQVVELGRQFQLPPNVLWWDGKNPATALESNDIRATFRALQSGDGPDHSLAWDKLYAEKVVTSSGNGFRVTVNLSKGYIEPLALMNAKIVPAWALQPGQAEKFGREPVGSGPFVYAGMDSDGGRSYAKFIANPYYSTRASKQGSPRFSEVRFYSYTDGIKEAQHKEPWILLDLNPEEAAKIKEQSDANHFHVLLPSPKAPNHRVYFLAVNHRQQPLDDVKVRTALALAINREKLLDEFFRGPLKRQVHKAINSPYPANCWACDPKLHNRADTNSCDPFDAAMARSKLRDADKNLPRGDVTLTLKYPEGDAVLANAMTALAEQVQETLKDVHPVQIRPQAVAADRLQRDLETTNYELALCHYDFPDDTFWLGPLFAPRKPAKDAANLENIFGFENPVLTDELQKSINFREFAAVQKHTQLIHKILVEQMPVIPLWQLDPLHAVHQEIKTTPFDPQRVFTDIERWHLGQ
jgi:ABC-type oligopeptide transport system substrate-binding subunit